MVEDHNLMTLSVKRGISKNLSDESDELYFHSFIYVQSFHSDGRHIIVKRRKSGIRAAN